MKQRTPEREEEINRVELLKTKKKKREEEEAKISHVLLLLLVQKVTVK